MLFPRSSIINVIKTAKLLLHLFHTTKTTASIMHCSELGSLLRLRSALSSFLYRANIQMSSYSQIYINDDGMVWSLSCTLIERINKLLILIYLNAYCVAPINPYLGLYKTVYNVTYSTCSTCTTSAMGIIKDSTHEWINALK